MFSCLKAIKEDFITHNKQILNPGFLALMLYRYGSWSMGIKIGFIRYILSFPYHRCYAVFKLITGIEVPYSAKIGSVKIEHSGFLVIHSAAKIGSGTIIRQGVTIGNRHRERPNEAPEIGENVSIGANAVILGKIKIGNNAQIGAASVVLCNVPNNATVVGNPGKILNS